MNKSSSWLTYIKLDRGRGAVAGLIVLALLCPLFQDPRVQLLDAPPQVPHAFQSMFRQATKRPRFAVPGRSRGGRLHGEMRVEQLELGSLGQALQPPPFLLVGGCVLRPSRPEVDHGSALPVAVQNDHPADPRRWGMRRDEEGGRRGEGGGL